VAHAKLENGLCREIPYKQTLCIVSRNDTGYIRRPVYQISSGSIGPWYRDT